MLSPNHPEKALEKLVREDWGRALSILIRDIGDFALAEDCLQEAAASALVHWKHKGLPKSPMAWLIKTARRKAIDRFRRQNTALKYEAQISYLTDLDNQDPQDAEVSGFPDKRLELLFTACHPALDEKTRLALTLKTIGGLSVEQIASAFLDKPATMAARLTRAKKKIKSAAIAYEVPAANKFTERLNAVLGVIYLIFNEAYSASSGQALHNVNLSDEAIRLGRILNQLMPETPEAEGLLALMLLHDARRPARLDHKGEYVPLEYHDRAKWTKSKIKEGREIIQRALKRGKAGPYQIQASISALHCEAESWAETDWAQIVKLYETLYKLRPNPVVQINLAIALSYAESAEAALQHLSRLTNMEKYRPFLLARADMNARLGNADAASLDYMKAINMASNRVERSFIQGRLQRLKPGLPQ